MNVSSVKNLNGEIFSAVQDTALTDVVQTNSAQWGQGGGGSVSSKYGTITVDGSDIEATNSAIKFKSYGFTTSFGYKALSEYDPTAIFTWDNYSEGTTVIVWLGNQGDSDGLTYSSNTNVTGLITAPQWNPIEVSLSLPNATAIQFSANHRYDIQSILVTAASSFQVSELAWKNDLPTYQYDSTNKISAINGSALAGGGGGGDVPSYEYTDGGLVSAIGSSGLYSTSAGTATYTKKVLDAGTLGGDLTWSSTVNGKDGYKMVLNPSRTQFGTTSGIFNSLRYATGACISYGSYPSATSNKQWFGGYFKGNEWMISNASFGGAMLAGFKYGNVYLSGARTNGDDFNLCQYSVSGKNSNGSWKYGNEEDTLLRTLSSQIAYLSGVIDRYHS